MQTATLTVVPRPTTGYAEALWSRRQMSVSTRRAIFAAVDGIVIVVGTLSLRVGGSFDRRIAIRAGIAALIVSLVWRLAASIFDVYAASTIADATAQRRAFLKAAVATASVLLALSLAVDLFGGPVRAFLSVGALAVMQAGAHVVAAALVTGRFRQRVLVLGDEPAVRAAAALLAMEGRGCYEVAYVAGRPIESLIDIIARVNATTVVAARHRIGNALDIAACVERGVVFRSAASVFEELTGRVPVTYLGSHEDTACALPDRSSRCDLAYRTAKRAADIVLASAGMVVLVIMLPIVALAISIDSPGPIFYSQERLGRGGRPFRAWKFRSMIADAEQGRPQWAAANDVRVTRVGRLLRAAHLDEFPQFLNILKGEMSAVGPRPERPEFAEVLSRELPFYNMRHGTKPGMAGWGLVNQGYSSSSEDAALKLEYDLYYLKYQSCWLDLVILMKTAIDTLMLRGR